MKTIKVIDLLNMIANGEEVPKKIKYKDRFYTYEEFNIGYGKDYFEAEWKIEKGYRATINGTFIYLNIHDYSLNDEVEIIEDKKIETIDPIDYCHSTDASKDMVLVEKINEIINYINKNEEEK